jgi:hypothetical protein
MHPICELGRLAGRKPSGVRLEGRLGRVGEREAGCGEASPAKLSAIPVMLSADNPDFRWR